VPFLTPGVKALRIAALSSCVAERSLMKSFGLSFCAQMKEPIKQKASISDRKGDSQSVL
jgi:hypothetical protein